MGRLLNNRRLEYYVGDGDSGGTGDTGDDDVISGGIIGGSG